MVDITPAHLRCASGLCPAVDYTPPALRCGGGVSSCPAVIGDNGVLTIVGKRVEHPKAGPGEAAVEIGEEYFSDLPALVALRDELEREKKLHRLANTMRFQQEDRDSEELTRLRAENERLMAMLARIDRVVVFEAHGLGNGFADEVEAILRAARASPAPLAPSQATDGAEGDKASHGPTSEVTAA